MTQLMGYLSFTLRSQSISEPVTRVKIERKGKLAPQRLFLDVNLEKKKTE